uniref:Uncharacterized protein n=1 Tax=Johnson-sea-linkia profunda TaxID=575876 RepID=A0A386AXP0_9CHLO|nr:hypothetical protein [Johnson-sea-linkia profunda]
MTKQKKYVLSKKNSSFFIFILQKCREMEMNIEPINKGDHWLLPVNSEDKIQFYPTYYDEYNQEFKYYKFNRYPEFKKLTHLPFFVANKGFSEDENDQKKLLEEGVILVSDWFLAAYLATLGFNSCALFNFYNSNYLFHSFNQFQLEAKHINSIIVTPADFQVISRDNMKRKGDSEDSKVGRSFCVEYIQEVYELKSIISKPQTN